jgi:hypothetical protein
MAAENTEMRTLDDATRDAAAAAVEAAKAAGWTQVELREWFSARGVELSEYLAAKRGEPVRAEVAGVLVDIGFTGLTRPDPVDDFPDIPDEMKAARRWLLWRAEAVEGEAKPRKTPYYTNGRHRGRGEGGEKISTTSPEDAAQFATYAEACAVLRASDYTGLGFALGEDRDRFWQGIDLDNLADHPGLQFVADDLPGYIERSPSGKGVHAIGFGRYFRSLGSNTTGIEAYAGGRYFTVTGQSAGAGGLTCLADFVEGRLAPLHGHKPQDTSRPEAERPGSIEGALAAPDLRKALTALRADDYHLWIRIGMALKGLGEIGRSLWLEWSQTSDKFKPEDARRWDSFEPHDITYRTVFAEAQARGWTNPGSARPEEPKAEEGEAAEEDDDGPFQASNFSGDPPERRWIVPEWIVEGAVNSLYGDGGLGKTLLAQQLACAVSMGATWLGMKVAIGPVLAVLCEDDRDELHRRHNAIKSALGYSVGNPFESVWLWPRVGRENVLIRWNKDSTPVLGPFYARILAEVQRLNPALLILDTLADFYAGNEIDRPSVNYFVKTVLGGLIKAQEAAGHPLTILLLGHPSVAGKASGAGYSGSTAWNNAVRSRMYLTRPEEGDNDERILTRGKANYAKSGDETAIRLFYADGVLHACEDAADGDSILWAAKEEAVRLTDRAWASGRPYSGQKTHPRYIYRALPEEMAKGGYGPQIVRQALRELIIDDGVLSIGKSHDKRGYRSAKHGG